MAYPSTSQNYILHDLRHTFITDLVTRGFDLKTIMEITGHKDIRMLIERYTHPGLDHKKQSGIKHYRFHDLRYNSPLP